MNKKSDKTGLIILGIFIAIFLISRVGNKTINKIVNQDTFRILASTSTKSMDEDLKKYAKSEGFNLDIVHMGDLEIVNTLNSDSSNYDAVWISNSIWLYMLDNTYLTTDSKSIALDPVVMGITKSKAIELGFVDNEVYNEDILNAIKENKLKYVMSSVTKTNTGATTYLNFLNSLAGSPEVLTTDMLDDENLKNDLKEFFKGVERVSGDEEYLTTMFVNGNYNAMINYESSLIKLNQELVKKNKEPLYLVYPVDGVAINDMPLAYINNSVDDGKKEKFKLLQNYLRSDEAIDKLESFGYRSWYGGTKDNVDSKVFNKDWGIDTTTYLKDMKYPSKAVITKALNLYIEALRKPTHVVFCLDTSGSMYGEGLKELQEAMNYILDSDLASQDLLQFSDTDKITVITFDSGVDKIFDTKYGNETKDVIENINSLEAYGGTNIYDPSIEALKILNKDDSNEYTKTVILMTDGQSNSGSFDELKKYYKKSKSNIPIYSITFGLSSEYELNDIAQLTNAKIFDGKSGLKEAFMEVRSYN
ncbi:MAG: VWA domain-containing protein [Bacilli bacterium]|nr:VWA domain-containing protein [Bacilli bacterium]